MIYIHIQLQDIHRMLHFHSGSSKDSEDDGITIMMDFVTKYLH